MTVVVTVFTNDPNRDDDPMYIVRLIKKVVTVSVETVGETINAFHGARV